MLSKQHTVLIADDHDVDRFFLTDSIQRYAPSFSVIGVVSDGQQVVEYLSGKGEYADRKKHPFPDFLILDVRMPRMNGLEVLEWLQTQHFPGLKVAMLADSSGSFFLMQALKLGVSHFYSKCVGLEELVEVVKDLETKMEQGRGRFV